MHAWHSMLYVYVVVRFERMWFFTLFQVFRQKMLGMVSKIVKDASTLRRMLFAVANLPPKTPNFWGIIIEFATMGKTERSTVTEEQARILIDNLKALDEEAFCTDGKLLRELFTLSSKPLGIILLSERDFCILCGNRLLVRSDKHSSVIVYDDTLGTIPATHYHKYCSSKSCSCTQFYGYYSISGVTYYGEECMSLAYFVSSRETALSNTMLKYLDAEIVIGQLSYKQRAEIYNAVHYRRLLQQKSEVY